MTWVVLRFYVHVVWKLMIGGMQWFEKVATCYSNGVWFARICFHGCDCTCSVSIKYRAKRQRGQVWWQFRDCCTVQLIHRPAPAETSCKTMKKTARTACHFCPALVMYTIHKPLVFKGLNRVKAVKGRTLGSSLDVHRNCKNLRLIMRTQVQVNLPIHLDPPSGVLSMAQKSQEAI